MWEAFLFYLCGALMLLAGIMMITSRSAVVAAVWLIFGFLNAAGIFALLSAPFLAVLQVLVYAGAIMVLFLFVIMMLQGPVLDAERLRRSRWLWPAALLPVAAIAVGVIAWFARRVPDSFGAEGEPGFGSAQQVAGLLLDRYLLAFELISIVLLVAIVGAVALAKLERRLPWR
jgi:NADH-quinone oxidoreductase subunit J